MARRNISLPDDLDEDARRAGLNVSALAQQAVAEELDRQSRMARLDEWLDELDAAHGPPSAKVMAEAKDCVALGRAVRSPGHRTGTSGVARAVPRSRRAAG